MENTHNFIVPRTNLMGIGALKDLSTKLLDHKLSKVLIVTDKNLEALGYVDMIGRILKALFISYEVFDGVAHPNCTTSFVEDGMLCMQRLRALLREFRFVLSIGGGTNHDCAKAMAVLATNGGEIGDYEGYDKILKPTLRHIAVNTTAGSGSEVSCAAVVTDKSKQVKMVIISPKLAPYLAVNDPMLMQTMPREVTASSGIDVISHAVEALSATEASPVTDALALGAIRLTARYLPRAYENGNDLEAREKMMYAASMAGMAFSNGGLGYIHALAHQLGGFYEETPHGCWNAVLLRHVLDFNAEAMPEERLEQIACALGTQASGRLQAVDRTAEAVGKLSAALGLVGDLRSVGAREEDFPVMAANALKDVCALTNPRQGTVEEIERIFRAAY